MERTANAAMSRQDFPANFRPEESRNGRRRESIRGSPATRSWHDFLASFAHTRLLSLITIGTPLWRTVTDARSWQDFLASSARTKYFSLVTLGSSWRRQAPCQVPARSLQGYLASLTCSRYLSLVIMDSMEKPDTAARSRQGFPARFTHETPVTGHFRDSLEKRISYCRQALARFPG